MICHHQCNGASHCVGSVVGGGVSRRGEGKSMGCPGRGRPPLLIADWLIQSLDNSVDSWTQPAGPQPVVNHESERCAAIVDSDGGSPIEACFNWSPSTGRSCTESRSERPALHLIPSALRQVIWVIPAGDRGHRVTAGSTGEFGRVHNCDRRAQVNRCAGYWWDTLREANGK